MNQVTAFFEGLGLGRITWNKTAFTLFEKFDFPWSAIPVIVGVVLGLIVAMHQGKKYEGIAKEDIFEVCLCMLLGSRVLDVIAGFGVIKVTWLRELCFFGGIFLAVLFAFLVCRALHLDEERTADAVTPALLLGGGISVFYALFDGNAESVMMGDTSVFTLFGKELALPTGEGTLWHLFRMGLYPNNEYENYMVFLHPLFLYTAVWLLLGFVFLLFFRRKKAFDGEIFLLGLIWFSVGMFFVMGLSTSPFATVTQIFLAVVVVLAIVRLALHIADHKKAKKRFEDGLLIIVRGDSAVS